MTSFIFVKNIILKNWVPHNLFYFYQEINWLIFLIKNNIDKNRAVGDKFLFLWKKLYKKIEFHIPCFVLIKYYLIDFLNTITLSEMNSDTTCFNYIEKMISTKIKSILTRFNFN